MVYNIEKKLSITNTVHKTFILLTRKGQCTVQYNIKQQKPLLSSVYKSRRKGNDLAPLCIMYIHRYKTY